MGKFLSFLPLTLVLAACQPPSTSPAAGAAGAATPAAAAPNPAGLAAIEQTLQKFAVADLQAADSDAKAHGDTVAATCYEALIPIAQSQASLFPDSAPKGGVSAFQMARDGLNAVQGIPTALKGLNVPCGPLVLDAEQTLIALGLKIAPAGLPALPAIP